MLTRIQSCPQGLEFRERERPEILVIYIVEVNQLHSGTVVLIENVRTAKRLKIVQIAQCHKHLGDNTRFENECFNVPKSLPYHSRLRK